MVSGFNDGNGDKIDVSGVTGIFTFADIQSRATLSGPNTIIDFGGGNTMTLNGVTSLQQSDFVFRSPDDRSIFAVKGGGVVLTNADLDAGDTGTAPANVVYTITGLSHGFLRRNNGATTQALAQGRSFLTGRYRAWLCQLCDVGRIVCRWWQLRGLGSRRGSASRVGLRGCDNIGRTDNGSA